MALQQELIDCMELTFDATNVLTKALNTHMQCKLSPIKMKETGTSRENCDIFLATIKSIQDLLRDTDKKLSSKLEPNLFKKLHDFHETDHKMMQTVRSVLGLGTGVVGLVASGLTIKFAFSIVAINTLSPIATISATIGASTVRTVIGVVVGLSVDLIFSMFLGAIERGRREAAIQELEPLMNEFKLALKSITEPS